VGTAGQATGVAEEGEVKVEGGGSTDGRSERVIPALSITVHYGNRVAVEFIMIVTIAIESIITAHGVLVHLVGIAVKNIAAVAALEGVVPSVGTVGHLLSITVERIVAVSAVKGVVPALGGTVHEGTIAEEGVVAAKAVDRLVRSVAD
jgi:hypothetical protein